MPNLLRNGFRRLLRGFIWMLAQGSGSWLLRLQPQPRSFQSELVWVLLSPFQAALSCEQRVTLVAPRHPYGNGLRLRLERTLVPPRQSRQEPTSADAIPVPGGSYAPTDRLYDLSVKIGSFERSITYLEAHAENSDRKLDAISNTLTAAKATFNTLKVLFIAICVGTWGVISALFLMWAKHYFNW